ncbi:MAG: adenosylmethionine--8-amino-7-oxononanoate transaminase [Candidatus Omnitrophota bacterium]|jgi:adenosylmethionine-8-amino-7-oxononanoate transaminase
MARFSASKLRALDRKHVWHPFTQMQDWMTEEFPVIRSAKGVWLRDVEGKKYLDGVSSLWCNVHGHRVSEIDRAVAGQLRQVAHSTFLGLSNVPAIELAEKLAALAPRGLTRVFYSDSGSEAVEIALKIAFQYWRQAGCPQKTKFVKLSQAYHGDTIGSVSVGGIDLFHRIYRPMLFRTFEAPSPDPYRWPGSSDPARVMREALAAMEAVFRRHRGRIAALVMEPLMQGAAGMIRHPDGYLSRVRALTKRYGILLILDEVATGFGRTGTMFACERERVVPDLLAAAKGLTGGYLPLAVTLVNDKIFKAFLGKYEDFKAFFHGHTYTANPLACRAALASLALFRKKRVLEKLRPKIARLQKRLRDFYRLPIVGDVRQAGFMAGIELVRDRRTKAGFSAAENIGMRVTLKAREKGVILRPLGPVIVLMPPLGISGRELERLLDVTYESIAEISEIMTGRSEGGLGR